MTTGEAPSFFTWASHITENVLITISAANVHKYCLFMPFRVFSFVLLHLTCRPATSQFQLSCLLISFLSWKTMKARVIVMTSFSSVRFHWTCFSSVEGNSCVAVSQERISIFDYFRCVPSLTFSPDHWPTLITVSLSFNSLHSFKSFTIICCAQSFIIHCLQMFINNQFQSMKH